MLAEQLAELEADREDRVQRRQRVLEDHRDPVGPHLAALLVGQLQQVDALVEHLARR